MNVNFDKEYIENLIEINSNLRNQLEQMYKLIRTKIKIEYNSNFIDNNSISNSAFNKTQNFNNNYYECNRLENILNELEILKTSLSFSLQKQSSITSIVSNKTNLKFFFLFYFQIFIY